MADEFKSIRDNLLKAVINGIEGSKDKLSEEEAAEQSLASLRAILGTITSRAGKSKDDAIQILSREVGVAIAAMLREPLRELAENRRLQITFEFVPKTSEDEEDEPKVEVATPKKKTSKKKKKTAKSP